MRSNLLLIVFLSSTICAGQSVLTTADSETRPAQAESAADNGQNPSQELAPMDRDQTRESITPGKPADSNFERSRPPLRVAAPLRMRSEFEQFAEDATGRRLPVYGRQLFDLAPTTFAPVENVPVPADYVLGPGDQLLIRAWGKIDLNSRETVDRNGQINLPKVGTVTVAGLRYAQVEGFLHTAISALFKDFELNVTLGQLRTMQIFVLGDARQPGAYTVSSLSTLVDALFSSGGPSATGSMRCIQLRREGKIVVEFDIYDLIERGDKSRDVPLLPGDILFIPPIGPQIAISGAVNRPGLYELRGEASVETGLAYAGGITSLADAGRVVLERIDGRSSRSVEEFALDSPGRARALRDGDLLRIFPLSPKFANAVTLRGNVSDPGLYPWKEGMRLSDLIPNRDFLITRGYWNQQNHLVKPEPAHPFASRDNAAMSSTSRAASVEADEDTSDDPRSDRLDNPRGNGFRNPPSDTPENQGKEPGLSATFNPVTSIGRNSAEINWEYALIERLDEHDLSTNLIPFNLGRALDHPASADNQRLRPGDVITVFSRADLELPMEKHASLVRVGGEVNAPGIYRVNPEDTLRAVVEKAGGLTSHSYLYASIFTRVSTREAQEAQLRQSSEQMQRDLATKFANASPQPGQSGTEQQAQLAMQQAALARLTSVKPTGRVVLNMKPESTTVADIPDLPLEDGDAFYIPPRLSTVQVAGAVYNANAFRYESGERLITYLNDAGGATRDGDRKRIFVIRADGTVVSRQSRNLHSHGNYENLKLLPGDAIVVPEKLKGSSKMADFVQATQFMSQLALTAAALNVIK